MGWAVNVGAAEDGALGFQGEGGVGKRGLRFAGAVERVAKRTPQGISVGDVTVTGTDDLLLAALLTAHEAGAEVRGLAACHRLLPIVKGL